MVMGHGCNLSRTCNEHSTGSLNIVEIVSLSVIRTFHKEANFGYQNVGHQKLGTVNDGDI